MELHPQQRYIIEVSEELGLPLPKLVYHNRETHSCIDKITLLNEGDKDWQVDQMVKALYFHGKDIEGESYKAIVFPEFEGRINPKKIFPEILKLSKNKAARHTLNRSPSGMQPGTCTPFPRDKLIGSDISALLICDHPRGNPLVDISIGGIGSGAKKVSMHIEYEAIVSILEHKFPENIYRVPIEVYQ